MATLQAVKRHNDGDWMPYRGCLLVAAFVKIVSCLANSIFCGYTYADKTYIEVFISSYWLQLFMHKFRLACSISQNGSHFSSK